MVSGWWALLLAGGCVLAFALVAAALSDSGDDGDAA